MGRTVTAVVTYQGTRVGAVGPFDVDIPWWAEVAPVVERVQAVLGVPVVVLRLLGVQGSDGARDGHVTYHVAALERPDRPATAGSFVDPTVDLIIGDEQPLRLPWARESGIRALFAWAARHVTLTGRPEQRKTWNLAALFRLPTTDGPCWVKAIPPFAAAEPIAIAALAAVDPGLVPRVHASEPGRLLLGDIPGTDCWDAGPDVVVAAIARLVAAQARLDRPPPGLPDRRPEVLDDAVRRLLDGPVGEELTAGEATEVKGLLPRWELLAACGLPDTLVHGDFHPGNWRHGEGDPVVLDFADAHLGSPVLDGLRAINFLPADRRPTAASAWIDAWTAARPGSRPADALRIAEPLAHLAYAVRYQEFLDNIEPSERVYHAGDPAAAIRHALAAARSPGPA